MLLLAMLVVFLSFGVIYLLFQRPVSPESTVDTVIPELNRKKKVAGVINIGKLFLSQDKQFMLEFTTVDIR